MTSPAMRLAAAKNHTFSNHAWTNQMRQPHVRIVGKVWMLLDVATVAVIAVFVILYRMHLSSGQAVAVGIHNILSPSRSIKMFWVFLTGFTLALVLISRRVNLYRPMDLVGLLQEQRLSLQAVLSAGLLLAGAIYLLRAEDISRMVVVSTVVLTGVVLGSRRLAYRIALHRRRSRGRGLRNVLIVGVGSRALAMRQHLASKSHLGYSFLGYIAIPGEMPAAELNEKEIAGDFDDLFNCARRRFASEIFLASHCNDDAIDGLVEKARSSGMHVRVIPEMYGGLAWINPVQYIGGIPTIPIHWVEASELAQFLKRSFDITFSVVVLLAMLPIFAIVAFAIKLDSPGPVFYVSERIGKKGNAFRCIKFRTMFEDAELRRQEIAHLNNRDGILFKVANDPRITPLGRFLRKYSIDELPQFVNVLRGEMSVVGPRPPIAPEVSQYELSHLRRLDVTPGITGLWQVEARQDPSFDNYVSLDLAYIDHWSPWLDFKIILRTIGAVFAGSGS